MTTLGPVSKLPPATLETLWQTYHAQIYGYLYKLVRDHDVTADLTSTVFLRCTVAYANGNAYDSHESGWIWTVTRNVLIDHWRAMRRVEWVDIENLAEQPSHDAPLDELLARSETAETLHRAINRLPSTQATVAACRLCGYTHEELAELLGRSYLAIKALQNRAEESLRALLDPAYVPPPTRQRKKSKGKAKSLPAELHALLQQHGPLTLTQIAERGNGARRAYDGILQAHPDRFAVVGYERIQNGQARVWGLVGIHTAMEVA